MANPNIMAATTMHGTTDVLAVGTVIAAVTTNAAASNAVQRVNSLMVSNGSTGTVSATVDMYRGAVSYPLIKNVAISAGAMLTVIAKDTPIYLQEGDVIRASASVGSAITVVCSSDILA